MARLVAHRVGLFRAGVYNSTHKSLQAYMSLRRYTAATYSIPPAWRRLLP